MTTKGLTWFVEILFHQIVVLPKSAEVPPSIEEVQKFVNQNAQAAAGNFVSAVGNFSKMLSKGSLPETSTKRRFEGARVSMSSVKQVGIVFFIPRSCRLFFRCALGKA